MSEYEKIVKELSQEMPGSVNYGMVEERTDFSTPVPPMPRQAGTTISGVMKGKAK
jgi:hypothetical protein